MISEQIVLNSFIEADSLATEDRDCNAPLCAGLRVDHAKRYFIKSGVPEDTVESLACIANIQYQEFRQDLELL